MSVFIDSKQSVWNMIVASNAGIGSNLNALIYSAPKPIAGSWLEGVSTKNTYVKVTPDPVVAPGWKGKQTIRYNRLQMADYSHFKPVRKLPAYQVTSTLGLLPNILYYFGLFFSERDVIDEPLTLDGNGAGTVTLRAKDTSPIWLGSLTFDVVQGGADISTLLTVKNLNGLNYPVADPSTQTSALLYMYPYDFTGYRDALLAMAPGVVTADQAATLVTAFKALDKGTGATLWTVDNAVNLWSLGGASVFFSGLNSMALPTNQSYKYVVGLELRGDVTIPSGRFYLHFNDPEDPNSAD